MPKICKVDGCNRPVNAKGYCGKHYQQVNKQGRLTPELERAGHNKNNVLCKAKGCGRFAISKG